MKIIPGYGKFYRPPQKTSCCTTNVLFRKCEPPYECWSVGVPGQRAFRRAVVGALRWYLPISIPYLLRRTPCHLLAMKEAHTCLHLLNAGTIPSTLRSVAESYCGFIFSSQVSVSLTLFIDFPTCRGIALIVCILFVSVNEEGLTCRLRCSYFCPSRFIRILFKFFIFLLCFPLLRLTLPFF